MNKQIKLLIFSSYYLPGFKGGGPIKTIKNLVDNLNSQYFDIRIVTSDRDLGDLSPYSNIEPGKWNQLDNTSILYIKPGLMGYMPVVKTLLSSSCDIVYLNSFFSPGYSFVPLIISKALGHQVVISPKGEFSKGALGLKPIKKKVFISIYKLLRLHRNTIFQASSSYEEKDIYTALSKNIDVLIAEDISAQNFSEKRYKKSENMLKIVLVSRISPMKNILVALEILENVKHPVQYHIYGPIEDSQYWEKCQEKINTLPSHIHVEYMGELVPTQVVETMSLYDVFFLPTQGENYGHVIAEALCAGLPLVISDQTPWKNLESLGIGWDLPINNLNAFSTVIDKLAKMPVDKHMKMRETVLAWAKQKFSQRDAIEANISIFRCAYNKKKGINNAV